MHPTPLSFDRVLPPALLVQEATSTHANGRSLDDQRLPENTHLPDGGASSSSSSNGAASSNGVSGRAVPQRSSRGMAVRLEDVHFGYAGQALFRVQHLGFRVQGPGLRCLPALADQVPG